MKQRWPVSRTPIVAAAWLVLVAGLGGCEQLDPAPEDLDGLYHYFWRLYDHGADEELAGGVVNADLALAGGTLDEELDGTLTALDRDELDLVGMSAGADPGDAQGLYLVARLPCTLAQIEAIAVGSDLGELYAGEYEGIERDFTSDVHGFTSRATHRLTWTTTYEDDLGGADYVRQHDGGMRFVPELDAELSPWGPALLLREWMPSPAVFDGDGETFWDQDYQVDVVYETAPGEVVHLLGFWRDVGMGEITADNEFMQTMILRSRRNWDERTAEICDSGEL